MKDAAVSEADNVSDHVIMEEHFLEAISQESNHDLSHDHHENITDEDDPEENNFKSEERTSRHSEPDPEHSDKVPTSRIGSSLPLRNIAAENSGSNICSEVLAEIFVLILALHQCLKKYFC